MSRGFKIVSIYKDADIVLPQRKTFLSAGYDIAAAEDTVLGTQEVTLIPTGIKAYMENDEYLGIHIRSGLAVKNNLTLINGQGIIDADYYNNEGNEGHILIAVFNHGSQDMFIAKGTRVAQGIFYKYLLADHDKHNTPVTRKGGLGSTGQ